MTNNMNFICTTSDCNSAKEFQTWMLVKPLDDFYAIKTKIETIYNSLREYVLFKKVNVQISGTKQDPFLVALKDVANGEREYVMYPAKNVDFSREQNVYSKTDAIKYWCVTVRYLVSCVRYYSEQIRSYNKIFNSLPVYLRTKCEFCAGEYLDDFLSYIKTDSNCKNVLEQKLTKWEVLPICIDETTGISNEECDLVNSYVCKLNDE